MKSAHQHSSGEIVVMTFWLLCTNDWSGDEKTETRCEESVGDCEEAGRIGLKVNAVIAPGTGIEFVGGIRRPPKNELTKD